MASTLSAVSVGLPYTKHQQQTAQTVQVLYAPVKEPLEAVRESLKALVPPDSELLVETLSHSLASGGKLLRPAVTLLSGLASRSKDVADHNLRQQQLIETAAISEMIHVATLLHDDVLDEADLRRGRKTVRNLWGNTVSILSGDYLLAQASLKLSRVGIIRLVAIYSGVLSDLCDGEVEQIRTSYNLKTLDWQSYFKKSICKTASLFAAGCESAGVINELPEDQIQALRQFGTDFGIAFQIMDDLLDYTASEAEMGKPVLDDLRNGLLNAPVLLALESDKLNVDEIQILKAQIDVLFATAPDDQDVAKTTTAIEAIQRLLQQADAIEQTRRLAEDYVNKAIAAIGFLPDSIEKQSLVGLAQYSLQRRS